MTEEMLQRAGIEERDLTEQELADLERVNVRTVQNWRQRGVGPPYRKLGPGRAAPVRYPVRDYREWRASTVVASTASTIRILGGRTRKGV
jgi:hypothetical protein